MMRYLLALESPRLKPEDYERVPLDKADDFEYRQYRQRLTGSVQPVRNEAEGRPSSKSGGKGEPATSKMAAPKMADRDRDEAPPYRTRNSSQRFQRPNDRRAEQEWSSEWSTAATDQLLSHVTAHMITVILCFKTEKTGTLCFQRIRRYPDRNTEQSQSGPQEPGRGRDSTGAGMRSLSNGRDRPGSVPMCRPGGNA